MSSSSHYYPLIAIPAYYLFSIQPHVYAMAILSSNGYKVDNANPKASISPSAVKGKVTNAVFQKYQRAESAQSNNHEQLPLFASAILASIIAERNTTTGLKGAIGSDDDTSTGLMTFVVGWFVFRTLYVISYIQIADHSKSFIRSGFYMASGLLAFYQFYKAAVLLR